MNVLVNDGLTVDSSATMSFKLIVPFKELPKAQEDTELKDLGLGQSDCKLGSILGDNVMIGGVMEREAELATRASSYFVSPLKKAGYCIDTNQGCYAVYCDNDENVDVSGKSEFQGVSSQTGFILQWNDKCNYVSYSGKKISLDLDNKMEHAVSAMNSIFSQNSSLGKNTRAVLFGNNIIILLDNDAVNLSSLTIDNISVDFVDENKKKGLF